MSGYYNVDEVDSALRALAAAYPKLCALIDLPNLTAEGRRCRALRIHDNNEPVMNGVLVMACAHANEWGGAEICIGFAADLLYAYAMGFGVTYGASSFSTQQVARIAQKLDVFILPVINPDGRHFSQTDGNGPLWRKNRNPSASGGIAGNVGVDVNRNYDFLWKAALQSSSDPSSDRFHGPALESEAEVLNVKWLLDTYASIDRLIDIHSANAPDIIWGWGDDEIQSTDPSMNFRNPAYDGMRGIHGDPYREYMPPTDAVYASAIAKKVAGAMNAVANAGYAIVQGSIYATGVSGMASDYCYSRQFVDPSERRIFGFGIEFGRNTPEYDWSSMEQSIVAVDSGLFEFCLLAIPVIRYPWSLPPRWVTLAHLVENVVHVLGGIPADGGGGVIPVVGPPIPQGPGSSGFSEEDLRRLVEELAGVLTRFLEGVPR